MVVVVANTDMSGVVVSGMAEEAGAQVLFFLRSASRLSTKFSGKLRPLLFSSTTRKHRRLSFMSKWLPYTHACYEHIHVRHLLSFVFPGNGARNAYWHFLALLRTGLGPILGNSARNACWHFFASLLRTVLGPIPSNSAKNVMLASTSNDTKER
jgi:hypothetical protein